MPSSRRPSGSWSRAASRSSSRATPRTRTTARILDALLALVDPSVTAIELSGDSETFDWLPQAPDLGWRRTTASAPDTDRAARDSRIGRHRRPEPRTRTGRRTRQGKWPASRSARRRSGTACSRSSTPTASTTVLRDPSTAADRRDRRRAVAARRRPRRGPRVGRRRRPGSPSPTTCDPSRAMNTATSSASAPRCWPPGIRRANGSSTSAGGSRPSSRCASVGRPATSRSRSIAARAAIEAADHAARTRIDAPVDPRATN